MPISPSGIVAKRGHIAGVTEVLGQGTVDQLVELRHGFLRS